MTSFKPTFSRGCLKHKTILIFEIKFVVLSKISQSKHIFYWDQQKVYRQVAKY